MPVRCPECRRTHAYAPPAFPCRCGAPIVPPVLRGAPAEPITHRNWTDEWVTVRCEACGRLDQWPQPELGCACGAVLRIPVRPVSATAPPAGHSPDVHPGSPRATTSLRAPAHIPLPPTAAPARPSFHPVTIRTARDAVTAAALYLRWLGYRDIVQPEDRSTSGIDLRAPGLVAQVDPTTRHTSLRAVECLWLNGLSASSASVFFSLAGYTPDARCRADDLGIPLFVMDLTGTPQPVNGPADELVVRGA
ncbi:hypothetical protein [Streptomyces purpureus]|uniref:hypothetical protein n=1 Tax=Streptomyces purpureus TaxID=1951 RepID=UPI0005931B0B|nr:hypothetical protein [Streptomyces purpureus]